MKKLLLAQLLIIGVVMASCTGVRSGIKTSAQEKRRIARQVEDIIGRIDPNVNLGIKISSLDSKEIIYQKNSSRHFIPGSTSKLITLASALYYLGPSFRFKTRLLTDEIFPSATQIKNLYILGSGDPSLMDHHLAMLALELKQMGIEKISGDIVVDDHIFDDVTWTRGAMWDDRRHGFAAPVSGLNLNYNRMLIKTIPSLRLDRSAHALFRPATSYLNIESKALTHGSDKRSGISLSVDRQLALAEAGQVTNDGLRQGDRISIDGHVAADAAPHYSLLAINDPAMLAGKYMSDQLKLLGVEVTGMVRRAKTPPDARLLTHHESRSLAEALIDFTKASNNVANDALIKAIASNSGVIPATFRAGLALVDKFLSDSIGIDPQAMVSADGAGLSRYNLITPDQMIELLDYAANRFYSGPEFISALPIGGEDGTLGRRFLGPSRGNIRAKTGTMSGVSSLAGYLRDDKGKRYAFAIMINGYVGSSRKYTDMQDQILGVMFDKGVGDKQLAKVK